MMFLSHRSVSTFNLSIRLWQSTMATKAFGSTTSRLMLGSCDGTSRRPVIPVPLGWYPENNQPHDIDLMSQQQSVFRKVVLVAALEFCGYQQKKTLNQVLLLYW